MDSTNDGVIDAEDSGGDSGDGRFIYDANEFAPTALEGVPGDLSGYAPWMLKHNLTGFAFKVPLRTTGNYDPIAPVDLMAPPIFQFHSGQQVIVFPAQLIGGPPAQSSGISLAHLRKHRAMPRKVVAPDGSERIINDGSRMWVIDEIAIARALPRLDASTLTVNDPHAAVRRAVKKPENTRRLP